MPRISALEGTIPDLYRRNALSLLMFAYVTGVRSTLHTVTVEQAILMFMEDFGLTHDDYNVNSGLTIFNRMQKELINLKKSE